MTEPTVWIVQQTMRRDDRTGALVPMHDTSLAEKHGRRQTLLTERLKPWDPLPAIARLEETLGKRYVAGRDCVLFIGAPLACAMAFAIAARVAIRDGYSHVRVLYWSGRDQAYSEIRVPADMGDKAAPRGEPDPPAPRGDDWGNR